MIKIKPYFRLTSQHIYGKKNIFPTRYWVTSALAYGVAVGIFVPWFTDWRYYMKMVPYYNQRFTVPYEEDKVVYVKPYYTLEDDDQKVIQ